jgi:hypothetical protein
MNSSLLQNLLGCLVAVSMMFYAYRGGPVRYGTVPMPVEGHVSIFVCGLIIFVHSLKFLIVQASK